MADKIKAFAPGGLEALTTYIKNFRTDFETLVDKVNDALQEIGGAISELDDEKAYIDANMNFTLAPASWEADSSGTEVATAYPYKYTLTINGVTAETRVDAVLDAVSAAATGVCGLSTATETNDNAVIFRSRTVPAAALTGKLYITKGESAD